MAIALVTFVGAAASQANAPAAPPNATQAPLPQPATPPSAVAPTVQVAPAVDPQRTTLSLDNDLITFIKVAGSAAGIFLAIFATLAVAFFGFDVRAARKSLIEASDDIRTRTDAIRKDHQSLIELKERLGKLGAELIEEIEKKTPASAPPSQTQPSGTEPNERPPQGPLSQLEDKRSFLRQLLAASEFEWSTAGTLAKRMSLSPETLIALADGDPLVQRGVGRNGVVLFRLKEFNNLHNFIPEGLNQDEWTEILWRHAAKGKKPGEGGKGAFS